MDAPDLRDLKAFAAIAHRKSFRRAALDLGVSVSSLSTRMRTLERTLGLGLLHRTTRSVGLTEAGEQLMARLVPALREVDQAVASLQGSGTVLTGRLRINAPPVAIDLVLIPIVTAFLAQHPGVVIEVTAESSLIDIVAAGFDAGVRYEETLGQDMVSVPLGPPQRYVVVAAPALLATHGIPKSPKELASLPCLSVRFPSGLQPPWEFEKGSRKIKISPRGPLIASHHLLLTKAAIDGLGFLMMIEGYVAEAVAAGTLVRVLDEWNPWFPGPFLYYPSRRQPPATLAAFVAFAKARRKNQARIPRVRPLGD
jgi:DNA-binding transcriptional LysR family regulator